MENNEQPVGIFFDENSKKIMGKLNEIHRHSVINIAISLVAKTNYYKTLTGEISENIEIDKLLDLGEDIISPTIQSNDETATSTSSKEIPSKVIKPKKPTTKWDF